MICCETEFCIRDIMDMIQGIREALPLIVKNFNSNVNTKKVLNDLITEVCCKKLEMERLYLMYLLVQLLTELPEADVIRFFDKALPIPLSPNVRPFVEQMVSLAVSLGMRKILTAATKYLQGDEIRFPIDLEVMPQDLATLSPQFTAAVISKGCFFSSCRLFTPELLTSWLRELMENKVTVSFDAQKVIEYSLVCEGKDYPALHLEILKCILQLKVTAIPAECILTLGKSVARSSDTSAISTTDRFSQLLLLLLELGLVSNITTSFKTQIMAIFQDNEFIRATLEKSK